ncbi:hypothetical protein SYNPS1DRAFT_26052 [Syncephalis pseudoplumigaleata]|uniref:Uncharacterized protein n=1 Tax=Syncephalis pseudoplumigaleata TaxID=1712513 RepID=A0A4P9YRB6_9FUNG|nr:hypothetical protein SYNPS1DRAFT_26052 [Syncephalis pseudoplumigaleata]|eukprot:RKP22274.1 hypothetical protein SYNPS1DRAFT_26052 [Syncephalis pseudoplumigaleata]
MASNMRGAPASGVPPPGHSSSRGLKQPGAGMGSRQMPVSSSFVPQPRAGMPAGATSSSRRKVLSPEDNMGAGQGGDYSMSSSRMPPSGTHRSAHRGAAPAVPGYKSILTRQKDASGGDGGHYGMYRG